MYLVCFIYFWNIFPSFVPLCILVFLSFKENSGKKDLHLVVYSQICFFKKVIQKVFQSFF